MRTELALVDRFFLVLVEEIRKSHPEYLDASFTVAEVYQSLVPYRTHRDRIGAEMNGDYEDALLRLLAGEGGYLELDSDTARERIRLELRSANPNTGMYREYAAVRVRLSKDALESLPSEGGHVPPSPQTELEVGGSNEPAGEAGEGKGAGFTSVEKTATAADKGEEPAASAGKTQGREVAPKQDGSTGIGVVSPGAGSSVTESGRGAEATPRKKALPGPDPDGESPRPEACPDCGSTLPDRASLRFCAHCGANVFVAPCGECGEVLERNWSFCIACGVPAP